MYRQGNHNAALAIYKSIQQEDPNYVGSVPNQQGDRTEEPIDKSIGLLKTIMLQKEASAGFKDVIRNSRQAIDDFDRTMSGR